MFDILKIGGQDGLKVIIGSGVFWAWVDALFMSVFFGLPTSFSQFAEISFVMIFLCSVPFAMFFLVKKSLFIAIVGQSKGMVSVGLLGFVVSLLLSLSGLLGNAVMLACACALGGLFMVVMETSWGACYMRHGVKSATPYVAGAFAFAPLIDVPLLCMNAYASAFFFACLPVVSALLFCSLPQEARSFSAEELAHGEGPSGVTAKTSPEVNAKNSGTASFGGVPFSAAVEGGGACGLQQSAASAVEHGFIGRYLNLSLMLLGAVALVMIGFGYLQHLISFTPATSTTEAGGIVVQLARGVGSIAIFALYLAMPKRMTVVYRVGFLLMIAGVMMLSFFFGGSFFFIPGALIIVGYTAFDLFTWVVFSHIAKNQSDDPFKTVLFTRAFVSLCSGIGGAAGMALLGNSSELGILPLQETTVVGYLIVIATVIVLSSEDARRVFESIKPPAGKRTGASFADATQAMNAWFVENHLTGREKEIALLLVQGRTQPWIAEALNISENTVNTHVRHVYQKLDVHDRQHFIDQALCAASPESVDA